MKKNNRAEEIQEEYYEFCLSLLQKLPKELINVEALAEKMHWFNNELKKEIAGHFNIKNNGNSEDIKVVEHEIEKLRIVIKNTTPDT